MSLIPADPGHLPPSTLSERSRELHQRGVLLRWRAQRLCWKSHQLLAKVRHLRQRWLGASIEDAAASCPSDEDEETGMVQQRTRKAEQEAEEYDEQ